LIYLAHYLIIIFQFFFFGRNFDETRQMMDWVRRERPHPERPAISAELEKLRPFPALEQLIPLADLLFVSKDFARSKGEKIRFF
jgi:hypothetical protein